MKGRTAYLVAGAIAVVLAVAVGLVFSLGGDDGVSLSAEALAQEPLDDGPGSPVEPDPGSGTATDPAGNGDVGSSEDLAAAQQCLADLGLDGESFDESSVPDFDVSVKDGDIYMNIEGNELSFDELMACLPDDLGFEGLEDLNLEDLDLGDFNLEDFNLEDLDLGDFNFEDLNLEDLGLGDFEEMFDSEALEACFNSDLFDPNIDPEAALEDPEAFLETLPEECSTLFGG